MSPAKKSPDLQPPAESSGEDGLFWENRVADTLGLPRERLRALRDAHMQVDVHYIRRRNSVVLTERGIELLNTLTGQPAPAAQKIAPATFAPPALVVTPFAPPSGPAPRLDVRVVRVPGNRRLLICTPVAEGTTEQLLVRVKTNENFMPGMTFEVLSGGQGLWQHVGRLPRRKGRW
jgi:hypothetical protein